MLTYLETSALVHRAEGTAVSPSPVSVQVGFAVTARLAAGIADVATCDVGLVEFHDVVTKLLRDTGQAAYDEAWCDNAIATLMSDLADGRLLVLPQPPKVFEHAMRLVTLATREHGKKFKVWDAVHLLTAVRWSIDAGQVVEFWTTDRDFEGFANLYPEFNANVTIRNVVPS